MSRRAISHSSTTVTHTNPMPTMRAVAPSTAKSRHTSPFTSTSSTLGQTRSQGAPVRTLTHRTSATQSGFSWTRPEHRALGGEGCPLSRVKAGGPWRGRRATLTVPTHLPFMPHLIFPLPERAVPAGRLRLRRERRATSRITVRLDRPEPGAISVPPVDPHRKRRSTKLPALDEAAATSTRSHAPFPPSSPFSVFLKQMLAAVWKITIPSGSMKPGAA